MSQLDKYYGYKYAIKEFWNILKDSTRATNIDEIDISQ